jgi:hypothetical protein
MASWQMRGAATLGLSNAGKASPVRAALFPQDRVTQEFVETYFRSRSSLTSPAWIGISRGTSNQAYKFIDGTNVAQVRADAAPAHGCC